MDILRSKRVGGHSSHTHDLVKGKNRLENLGRKRNAMHNFEFFRFSNMYGHEEYA